MIVPLAATFSTQISLLRTETIVKVANMLPDLLQQSCGAQKKCAGFHRIFIPVFLHVLRTPTQVENHFQEEAVHRISRNVQLIPKVLRDKLH